jgi:hypothetical protein
MSYTVPTAEPPSPELVIPDDPVIAPPSYNEPVVTRKELWSYYCMFPHLCLFAIIFMTVRQCIITEIMYAPYRVISSLKF